MLSELGAQCVEDCPSGHMSVSDNGTMRCVLCDGPCPQGKGQYCGIFYNICSFQNVLVGYLIIIVLDSYLGVLLLPLN